MRRRTLENMKIAAIYTSALFLCHTMRTVPEAYAKNARTEVVHTINNAYVDNSSSSNEIEVIEDEKREGTFALSRDWGYEDSEILMKIAMAEAEGESVEGKALVMMVVLNRMQSDDFPDTIEEVVFQENQFSSVIDDGRYYNTDPDHGCCEALGMILEGWDESGGALYFETYDRQSWMDQNCEYLFQEGNHKFFR